MSHINDDDDDDDIEREIHNMYGRTNMLIRRFGKCSLNVKLQLFRSYCVCFFVIAFCSKYYSTVLQRFKYCYHKCIKLFFGYTKYYSFTSGLVDLKLPCLYTVLHNTRYPFNASGIRVLVI